jgi:hypothetical protein
MFINFTISQMKTYVNKSSLAYFLYFYYISKLCICYEIALGRIAAGVGLVTALFWATATRLWRSSAHCARFAVLFCITAEAAQNRQ